jgi:hypothetical protein
MCNEELHALLVRLAIAAHRFADDVSNSKRLVTLNNLIEQIEEFNESINSRID